MAAYQQRVAGEYNKNIRIRRFQEGDMVLRKAFQNTTNLADGNWHQNGKVHILLKPKLERGHIDY